MKKSLAKMKTMELLLVPILASILVSSIAQSQDGLPYRPCEAQALPNEPWTESFDGTNRQSYCYYNSTVIYIQQDLVKALYPPDIVLLKLISPDTYIRDIGFEESPPKKLRDVNISFDYYYPYCDGSDGCPVNACPVTPGIVNGIKIDPLRVNTQLVIIGDFQANFSDEVGEGYFHDALDHFTEEAIECGCGKWCSYNFNIEEKFVNDFGSSFDNKNRDLGSICFEVTNMYLTNVNIVKDTGERMNVW